MPVVVSTLALNLQAAQEALEIVVASKRTAFVKGSPGVGKSALVAAIAKMYNLLLIDQRLSSADPTDLNGFPAIDKETNKATYVPFDTFPLITDELPDGYDGWLLFLDEMNSAERAVQKATYKVALDRKVGNVDMHPNVAIICAGNLDTDNALVEDMSSAMQSRLIHIHIKSDHKIWGDWAPTAGIDHRVTSYINYKPVNINNFDPDLTDSQDTFACERTWEFASDLVKAMTPEQLNGPLALPILAGTVGEGAAREFLAFCNCYKDLPTIQQVVSAPNSTLIPEQESTLFALSGSLAANAEPANIKPIIEFVNRMPKEYQVCTLREMVRRNRKLTLEAPVAQWVTNNSQELF